MTVQGRYLPVGETVPGNSGKSANFGSPPREARAPMRVLDYGTVFSAGATITAPIVASR
jgi:hypothetical protein